MDRKALLPEKRFRWRAGEITRLEAFCDVVFGFAITLLVVSLEVPHSYTELITAMRGFVPFAICFSQLVMIWRSHYKFSRRYGLEDSVTVFLNVLLLFLVLFYVYPLKFLFSMLWGQMTGLPVLGDVSWHEASVLMQIYGVGFASVFLIFVLMYAHAYRLRNALELNAIEVHLTRDSAEESAILAAVGLLSCLLAFKSPGWAGWSYFLLAPLNLLHGALSARRARRLA